MSIELVRLDDRLIHGQVVAGWVKVLSCTRIVVVDDEVAHDPFEESLMRIAVPEGIDVELLAAADCDGLYQELDRSPRKTILLFSGVADILELFSHGKLPLPKLNIGGVAFSEGREQLTESLFLSEEEIRMLAKMANSGVYVEVRPTPFDKAIDFHELLKVRDARRLAEG
ncbi:MAG TPA: PTS sugar transporter subunit IIB [bacterium]|nr:PTS sugar transporter subunit IIB [bacterium]